MGILSLRTNMSGYSSWRTQLSTCIETQLHLHLANHFGGSTQSICCGIYSPHMVTCNWLTHSCPLTLPPHPWRPLISPMTFGGRSKWGTPCIRLSYAFLSHLATLSALNQVFVLVQGLWNHLKFYHSMDLRSRGITLAHSCLTDFTQVSKGAQDKANWPACSLCLSHCLSGSLSSFSPPPR